MLKKGAEKLLGVEAIMHTPFKDNYELDIAGARKLVRHMIDNGIVEGEGCILCAGAVGEYMTMDINERKLLMEACLDEADGKVPIIVNIADTNFNVIKELAHHAQKCGAYALQCSPFYYVNYAPMSDRELVKFYEDLNKEVSVGIMIYANHWATQVYFDNILDELIDIEHIVSLKWAHPNIVSFHNAISKYADRVSFMSNMHQAGPYQYMLGMRGFCSQVGVYAPEMALKDWEAIKAQDWAKLDELLRKWTVPFMAWNDNLVKAGVSGTGGNTLKWASEILGLPGGRCRLPFDYEQPKAQHEEIVSLLTKNGLL